MGHYARFLNFPPFAMVRFFLSSVRRKNARPLNSTNEMYYVGGRAEREKLSGIFWETAHQTITLRNHYKVIHG